MDKENHDISYLALASFVFSIILHIAVIVLVKYVTNLSLEKPLVNPGYVLFTTDIKEKKERKILPVENKEEKNLKNFRKVNYPNPAPI